MKPKNLKTTDLLFQIRKDRLRAMNLKFSEWYNFLFSCHNFDNCEDVKKFCKYLLEDEKQLIGTQLSKSLKDKMDDLDKAITSEGVDWQTFVAFLTSKRSMIFRQKYYESIATLTPHDTGDSKVTEDYLKCFMFDMEILMDALEPGFLKHNLILQFQDLRQYVSENLNSKSFKNH